MKYRKLPVEIEAVQFAGGRTAIMDFIGEAGEYHPLSDTVSIYTLEGAMTASRGDYIIKGIRGEFYPCKPDIFLATYEKVA